MKTYIKIVAVALALLANCWATPSFAQSASLACRVNGGAERPNYCFASVPATGYSVANLLNLAAGDYSIEWITPISGACAPNSYICVYGVGADNNDQNYITRAIVTNLNNGVVSELSSTFYAQATCTTPNRVCLPTADGIQCVDRPRAVFC
jgi:hypothetical protein